MSIQFKNDFLRPYIQGAPIALAVERTLECEIFSHQTFIRPVLDMGCGDGLFAKILFAEKICTGIDSDKKELMLASRLDIYNELIECSGDAIPKPDSHYRTIFSNSALEHIPDIEAVLQEIHRLLAPEGKFYLTVPLNTFDRFTILNQFLTAIGLNHLAKKYRQFYNSFWKHYHCYSVREWEELVLENGFRIVEYRKYDPKWLCMLNDFFTPFGLLGFFSKRFTQRWILFPSLRPVFTFPLYRLIKMILKNVQESDNGGLVFMALTKQ